jgi:hypothetical protein
MNLGISRAGAVAVAELTMADDLDNRRVLAWLRDQDIEQLAVPVRRVVRGRVCRPRGPGASAPTGGRRIPGALVLSVLSV